MLATLGGCDLPYFEDTDDDLGLNALRRRTGDAAMPTGKGVRLALVETNTVEANTDETSPSEEANVGVLRSYVPDATGAGLQGKTITDQSGQTNPPGATSGHATAMARLACGQGGIAPGIQQIDAYFSKHWLARGPLRGFQPQPPQRISARLMNHSWIAATLPDIEEPGI
ncbi:MAG: hypothetical protein IID44_32080, partial [Planctomycetes bacterium]|nr:hypothetical protein [Planctomycetota bacterium]